MSNWINRLNLKDLWKARAKGELTIQELGKRIARRIEKLHCYDRYKDDLQTIVMDFEIVDEDVEEFDNILEELYDWADTPLSTPKGQMQRKMCWIATS